MATKHLENNVNHKNMIVMWNFLKAFAKEKNLSHDEINIFDKLNLKFPKKYPNVLSYYTDPKQWSPLDIYVQCYLKTKEITGDPNTFRHCGQASVKYRSLDNWAQIAKSISGPAAGMNYMPQIFKDWNDTKICELVSPAQYSYKEKKVTAILKYTFHKHIDPCDDFCSDPHILGIFEAFPTNWPKYIWKPWNSLPHGEVDQPMVQYDPIKLFNSRFFSHLNLRPEFEGGNLYIHDPRDGKRKKIGKKVILLPTALNGQEVYLGKYKDIIGKPGSSDRVGTLITETIDVQREPVCQAGVIMEAPYFLINYSCEEINLTKKFYSLKNRFSGQNVLLDELFDINNRLRQEIEDKNSALKKLENYSEKLEDMVAERTKQLKQAQKKLIESEKFALEHRITGGFAHEMRNALAGAQLEFNTALNYQDTGKSSPMIVKEAVTTLLKNISEMHKQYNIPKEDIAKQVIPELKTIADIADNLSSTIAGVSKDLERGLSITSQIRDYSKMAEMKAGDDTVNIIPLLAGFKKRYEQSFNEAGITYSVKGLEKAIIKADEIHLNSIFSNLILNAKDAIVETGKTDGTITVETIIENEKIIIKIQDNGPGIQENHINEIFEPFFSTKPTTGTGLGLGVVKKLVKLYNGTIDVKSKMNTGTVFTVTFPENQDG